MNRPARLPALAAATSVVLLSGCHLTPTSSAQDPPAAPTGIVTAAGHGWTSHGLDGPRYAPGSCHYRHGSGGELLPDPRCTPGALDPAVTAANLRTTICRPGGYTASVRPPERLTEPVKKQIMAAYGIPWSQAHRYELDHLVELSAGGASDTRNLWPEPNSDAHQYKRGPYVHNESQWASRTFSIANDKDFVEVQLFDLVCGAVHLRSRGEGRAASYLPLDLAQQLMATDWTTALAKTPGLMVHG